MTDKLYSRRRIQIPKLKKRKINKIKLIVFLILSSIMVVIVIFLYSAYPIFKASCESAAGSLATNITNEEVLNVMQNYSYEELINMQKDSNGRIIFMELNIVSINKVIAQIVSNIQKRIDKSPRTNVYINMGAISGVSGLKSVGPQFDIELETAGRIISDVKSEFESVGINQTLHKIYLNLNANIGILTPYANFTRDFNTTVLLTQAIIVGDVPETYYEFNGKNYSDEETVIETIK